MPNRILPARTPRTLPAAVWDRLKAAADAVGGVAPWRLFEKDAVDRNGFTLTGSDSTSCPVCLAGIAIACGVIDPGEDLYSPLDDYSRVYAKTQELFGVGFFGLDSAIISAGGGRGKRVPFEDVMSKLGIARAEEVQDA